MKQFILIILYLSSFSIIFANDYQSKFEDANKLYSEEKYSTAIDIYENLIKSGVQNSDLYYNLANAYYKIGDYTYSILNYEKAKKLNPNDEEINHNLRIANLQIVDKIEPVPEFFLNEWFNQLVLFTDTCTWSRVFIVTFWLGFISFAGFYLLNSSFLKKMLFLAGSILIALGIFTFVVSYKSNSILKSSDSGIIFEASIYVKSSPDNESTDLFILHEGTKVILLDEIGEWSKIRIADGNTGWLPKSAYQVI